MTGRSDVPFRERPPEVFLPVFVDALRRDGAEVDVGAVRGGVPSEPLWRLVATHGITRAALTEHPAAALARGALVAAGVRVEVLRRPKAIDAPLLVTGVVCAIAATGTVVLEPPVPGWRDLSPHTGPIVCVVTPDQLVATHADVPPEDTGPLPSRRVVLAGPGRSRDADAPPLRVLVAR